MIYYLFSYLISNSQCPIIFILILDVYRCNWKKCMFYIVVDQYEYFNSNTPSSFFGKFIFTVFSTIIIPFVWILTHFNFITRFCCKEHHKAHKHQWNTAHHIIGIQIALGCRLWLEFLRCHALLILVYLVLEAGRASLT